MMNKKLVVFLIAASVLTIAAIPYIRKKTETIAQTAKTIAEFKTSDEKEIHDMTNADIPEEEHAKLNGVWTIALFGLDGRGKNDLSGVNSDVIMIAVIDNNAGTIKLVSVYRDTCLKVGKRLLKANAAYCNGGPKAAVLMLNQNLDLEIDDYAAFSWKDVIDTVNILGGTDVDVTDKQMKWINGYITETVNSTGVGTVQLTHSGYQHLDGVQTVAYCRIRYDDLDFGRTEKQRDIVEQLAQKGKTSGFSVLNDIIVTVLPNIKTSIDLKRLLTLAQDFKRYSISGAEGFPETKFTKTLYSGGGDFVFADNLSKNVSSLHQFLYGSAGYIPSGNMREIGDKIDAYAGSSYGRGYFDNNSDLEQETGSGKSYVDHETEYRETVTETKKTEESGTESASAANKTTAAESRSVKESLPEEGRTETKEIGPGIGTSEYAETQKEIGPGITKSEGDTAKETAKETVKESSTRETEKQSAEGTN